MQKNLLQKPQLCAIQRKCPQKSSVTPLSRMPRTAAERVRTRWNGFERESMQIPTRTRAVRNSGRYGRVMSPMDDKSIATLLTMRPSAESKGRAKEAARARTPLGVAMSIEARRAITVSSPNFLTISQREIVRKFGTGHPAAAAL